MADQEFENLTIQPVEPKVTEQTVAQIVRLSQINLFNVLGYIETVSAYPTYTPPAGRLQDQIKIYQNTFTTSAVSASRIAFYSNKSRMWISAVLS